MIDDVLEQEPQQTDDPLDALIKKHQARKVAPVAQVGDVDLRDEPDPLDALIAQHQAAPTSLATPRGRSGAPRFVEASAGPEVPKKAPVVTPAPARPKAPIAAPQMAPRDVTQLRRPGEAPAGPDPVATAIGGAARLAVAPVETAAKAGLFIGQRINDLPDARVGPQDNPNKATDNELAAAMGVPQITNREAAASAAQLAAMGFAGPIIGKLAGKVTTRAAQELFARLSSAEPEVQAAAAEHVGKIIGRGYEGATIGAAYDPEHPARGAALGGILGAAGGVLEAAATPSARGRGVPPADGANLSDHPDRLLPGRRNTAEARSTAPEPPAPTEPDLTVEPLDHAPASSEITLPNVENALARLKVQRSFATDPHVQGELESRINILEAQGRKLRGEPDPEVATTAAAARARTAAQSAPASPEAPVAPEAVAPVTEPVTEPAKVAAPSDSDPLDQLIAQHQESVSPKQNPLADVNHEVRGTDSGGFEIVPTPPGGVNVVRVPTSAFVPDPENLQYKRKTKGPSGATDKLSDVKQFDERLAGVGLAWRNPATGLIHPVNMHHRLDLAVRSGYPSMNVILSDAKTADEAKAEGAVMNMAEGTGTALDAANFIRSTGFDINSLAGKVSLKGAIIRHGVNLSKLAPDLFSKVETGDLSEAHGSAIGEILTDPAEQRAAAQAVAGKRLSEGEVKDVARQVRDAGSEGVQQESLFGQELVNKSLFAERAQLATLVKKRLGMDKRLFGFVAKGTRAEELARAGNVIEKDKSQAIADQAGQLEEIFSRLYTTKGPISDALTEAARQVANGAAPKSVIDSVYPAIRDAIAESFGGSVRTGGDVRGPNDTAGDHQAAEGDAGEVKPFDDPSQNAMFEKGPTYGDLFGEAPKQEGFGLFQDDAAAGKKTEQAAPKAVEGGFAARQTEARQRADFLKKQLERIRNPVGFDGQPMPRGPVTTQERKFAAELAQLERIASLDKAIAPDELRARATAGEGDDLFSPTVNAPSQGTLLEQSPKYGDDEPKLAVLHNTSAESLLFADKIGGMPVPSLGIAKAGGAYPGMGDITLIGKPHLGDPTAQPIHDADVYSQTFPKAEYKAARHADAMALLAELEPFAKLFDDSADRLYSRTVEKADPQEAISDMLYMPSAQAAFLASKGKIVKPVMRDASVELPWVDTKAWKAFAPEWNTHNHAYGDPEYVAKADAAARAGMEEYIAKHAKGDADIADALRDSFSNLLERRGGAVGVSMMIERSMKNVGRRDVDTIRTRERLERAMKGLKPEFKAWAESKILPMHGEPFLTIDRKKEPFTVENVTRKMKGQIKAVEKTPTFGPGKARAASATRFSSMRHMKNASYALGDAASIEAGRERAKAALSAYQTAVLPYSKEDTWSALDASMRALAKHASGGSLVGALHKEWFRSVPQDVLDLGKAASLAMKEAPVPYFEAKPQRTVTLDEFAGAAVPRGTDPKVLAVLEKHGIQIEKYRKSNTDDHTARSQAVAALQKKLERAGKGVVFEESPKYGEPDPPPRLADTSGNRTIHEQGQKYGAEERQTESPAFKTWFGESTVVDGQGKPMVVYHGTDSVFSEFKNGDLGFHFGTQLQAHSRVRKIGMTNDDMRRAVTTGERADWMHSANVMPVYLKLENPLHATDPATWNGYTFLKQLTDRGIITKDERNRVSDATDRINGDARKRSTPLRELLQSKGYDGIVYENKHETEGNSFIVFEPTQVKSAIGNSGAFDASNPSIVGEPQQPYDATFAKGTSHDAPSQAQMDMFAAARDNPTGREALRMRVDDARTAFGSVAEKRAALAPFQATFKALEALKIPTVEGRAAQIAAHEAQENVDVRGARIATRDDMAKVVDLIGRSPTIEKMGILHLANVPADGSGFGDVAHVTIDTVGALTFANFSDEDLDRVVADARAAGTTHVAPFHNHPSGDAVSSKHADVPTTVYAAKYLADRGITLVGHLGIDHNRYFWIEPDGTAHDNIPFDASQAKYETAVEAGRHSFQGADAPSQAAAFVASVTGEHGVSVTVLDNQHRVLTVSPRTVGDLSNAEAWLPQLLNATGGKAVFIGAPSAAARALALKANIARNGNGYNHRGDLVSGEATWADDIVDVFAVFPDKTHSLRQIGLFNGTTQQFRSSDADKRTAASTRILDSRDAGRMEGRRGLPADVRGGAAGRSVTGNRGGVAETAFHGTPHEFDKFSLQHIGSGEGNQSFGYGLYFAGKKALAAHYRETLSAGKTSFQALTTEQNSAIPDYVASSIRSAPFREKNAEVDRLIAVHEKRLQEAGSTTGLVAQSIQNTIDALTALKRSENYVQTPAGKLYTVDIPDDDTMLHWDKPLSEQPDAVRVALKDVFDALTNREPDHRKASALSREWDNYDMEKTGQDIYDDLSAREAQANGGRIGDGNGAKRASELLLSQGIHGIKYLNGQSRAAGKGDYNYVVFDDSKISIKGVEERSPKYGEETPADEEPQVGIKNADSAATRQKFGMDERVRQEPRTQDEMYEAGKRALEADPTATDRILKELRENPERIVGTQEEAGILLKHRVDIENKLLALVKAKDEAVREGDDAAEHLARLQLGDHREQMTAFLKLMEQTGTATGRALAARKMMSKLDYSLGTMEAMSEAAKGQSLTEAELKRVRALHTELQEKLAAVEKDATAARERAAKVEAELHHAQMRLEVAGPLADRITAKLETAAEAAMRRIKARGLRASAGMDPIDLADHAIIGAAAIARGARKFAAWSDEMRSAFGEGIGPHLEEIFAEANKQLEAEIAGMRPKVEPRAATAPVEGAKRTRKGKSADDILEALKERVEKDGELEPAQLQPYLQQMALAHIRAGITEREPLLDRLHQDVQEAMDISRNDVRDALSGYGQFYPIDKAGDKVRLREIKAESQKLAQLEALQRGEAPKATGVERQEPNDETRRLTKQVNDAKKKAGVLTQQDQASRLKSALGAAKTRTRNAINDLQTEIDTGQRMVKGKSTLLPDKELTILRDQLAELRRQEKEVFGTPSLTDEQRLRLATAAAKRNAIMWNDRLLAARKGEFSPKRERQEFGDPILDALRANAKAARAAYGELAALDPEQKAKADERANAAYRRILAQREAELLGRMARQDYAPRLPKPARIYDAETMKKKADVEAVKAKFQDEVRKWEKANRTLGEKMQAGAIAYVRAGALSWPTVLFKLSSVALSRIVTTPLTDLVGVGVANMLPALAEGAPRHGTRSFRVAMNAEAAAQVAMWTEGLTDSGRMLRNGVSRLDLQFGKHKEPHAWYEYAGSLHGALKEPIKRAEFARSLYRRTVNAMARGEDTTSEVVQLRLATEAFLDAQYAIAMGDNFIVDAWNHGLRVLERKSKATGKPNPAAKLLATALRVEMPIVKAPTNVILDASDYIHGWLVGPARAAWAYAHGLEDLAPVERDSIIRMISKGLVGLAIMSLYFYKHDKIEFGGFYRKNEKRGPNDAPVGGAKIYGKVVDKMWLHNPLFMAGQFAAAIARVAPTRHRKKDKDPVGYWSAFVAANVGLAEEMPFAGSLQRDIETLKDGADEWMARKMASITVPGVVQWVARKMDDDHKNPPDGVVDRILREASDKHVVKRKPVGLKQNFENNLPGLRDRVPLAKK
jgi:hypothetical protein